MRIKIVLLIALFLTFGLIGFPQSKIPNAAQYPAKVENIKNIKVNLKSHKEARMVRSRLRDAAKTGVNFAGHYILTVMGCGTNCLSGAIIDGRNGRVFFPNELGAVIVGFCDLPDDTEAIVYQANSRLLVLSGMQGEGGRCGIYYLEWIGTKFRQVKFVPRKQIR